MFLRLNTQKRDGEVEPRLVRVNDISVVKPAPSSAAPARACVSLCSQPEFPVWTLESVKEIDIALMHMGVAIAPHGRT